MMTCEKHISLKDLVGDGYAEFWRSRHRYRLLKGGRASKKSKTTALNLITRLMSIKGANLLCLRQTAATQKDSVFADLVWAVERINARERWDIVKSEPRMSCKNGNEIVFRGLDDPLKLTSLSFPQGCLCFIWLEEAFEVKSKADFEKLELLLRGSVPEGGFKQFTLTFNPWLKTHWLYDFFTSDDPEIFSMSVNYLQNEFLDEQDRALFERIKHEQPERYLVEGLGQWGIPGETVFRNVFVEEFDESSFDCWREGLDWGFSTDPLAWIACHYDRHRKILYVCDEIYRRGLLGAEAADEIKARTRGSVIVADSAEPRSIAEMRALGMRIKAARKGPGSIESGIKWLQSLSKIIISPLCPNAAREFNGLHYQTDRQGIATPRVAPGDDHLIDAARYALEDEHKCNQGMVKIRL